MKRNRLPQRAAPLTAGRSKAKRQLELELSEPPELGAFAFFQVGDDLADDVVQLVGGLGFRNAFVSPDARPARPSSSQFTLTRVRRNTVVFHFGSRVG